MSRILLVIPLIISVYISALMTDPLVVREPSLPIHVLPPPCDTVPQLNQEIRNLVEKQIGKTVNRGECWDVAAMALNQTGAKWDKRYGFGRKVDPEKECVYPGDFIQFEGVKVRYTVGPRVYTETMDHHTAMVYAVKAKGVYTLAHQNTGTSGRKVGLSEIDLKTIIQGSYQIYRPEL